MAELAVGVGLAVPGVLDTLIKACLKGYDFISAARSADKDFEHHRYQVTVEQQRLKDLTTIVTDRIRDLTLRTDDGRFRIISSTLIRISQEFSDFKRLESLYGVSAEKSSKRSLIRRALRRGRSKEDTKREKDHLNIVLGLDDLNLDENLRMETLQNLELPLQNVINIYSRLRWACLDSKKVQTLLSKLEKYNSNMVNLVGGLNNVGTTAVVAVATKDKPHFIVPFPKNDNFIGQSDIEAWFKNHQQQRIASGRSENTGHLRLALCGLGGIGKTQDVLSFIYEYQNKRPVFWIHAGSIPKFETDCQNLASLAKIPGYDDKEQKSGFIVRRWLESPESGDWILVLDNADNMSDFYPTASENTSPGDSDSTSIAHGGIANFIPRGSKGTIIVTTRDREVALNLANQNVILKSDLNPEQAMELFYHHYPEEENAAEDNNTALHRLLAELQYLPLAIVQVAAYLNRNRSISPSQYLEMFEDKKKSSTLKRLLSKPHDNLWRDNGSNAETILTTFSISFRQIQKQSKLADSFLRFMACIDRKEIPQDLLFQIHLDGVDDEFHISEALDKLVNFSILQHANVAFESGKGYEIHALVHFAMRTYLGSGGMETALDTASTLLANTLPNSEYENWAAWRVYLPHVMAILENVKNDSEEGASLCEKAGHYLSEALGRYSASLTLHDRARKMYAGLMGEDSHKTLGAMASVGSMLQYLGRLKEAQRLDEKVLEVRRRTLGEEHPDTLRAMNNLAVTYTNMGERWKEVQELEEKVLEVRRRTLGEEHPDTLASMHNLANTYIKLGGRLKEVQELQEKVLEVSRRTLGEEHPDTLLGMQNLAITYGQLGRLNEKQELQEKVLEVRRRTLGEEHPDTLLSMQNLAVTYTNMGGRWKEVQELEEKVLEVRRHTLGEEHTATLEAMNNLAVTYTNMGGRWKEVKELEEKVLEVRRRTLGEEHTDTLEAMNNLAITYRELGKLTEAQDLEEKVRFTRRG
ncbi:P-loop containing nucleoside triphosphate hydrolase protein [Pyronema omphalodes]|nr:P-loop containing nucleoside triphosphate hydrolase protein [Pyronema omphalodes]